MVRSPDRVSSALGRAARTARCAATLALLLLCVLAHRRDPLAPIELDSESFRWMTRAACEVAEQHAAGRLVSVLEGGYDLDALGESVVAHVDELHHSATGAPRPNGPNE